MFLGIETKIWKKVIALAVPAMMGQLATIIYNLVDTYFIALTDDPNQIAAVTVSLPIFVIVMAIGTIFSMGGCSIMSRAFGAGEKDKIRQITSFAIYGIVITSVIILVVGLAFVREISYIGGADADSIEYTVDYLRYIFIGAPAIMLSNGMVAIFRGHDFVHQSAIGVIIGNVVNVIFDFIFIVVLHQGVKGAAIATAIGYFCGCIFYIVCIAIHNVKGYHLLSLNPAVCRPDGKSVAELFKIGTPSALVFILICVATIIINNYVGIYGSAAVAAYGIAVKINNIPVNLGYGVAQGVAPRLGFCYGAKETDKLYKTLRAAHLFGAAMGLAFLAVFVLVGRFLCGLFLSDATLKGQSYQFLIILSTSTFLGVCINVMANYFQAIGKAMPSTIIVFCKNIIVFVPAIILLNFAFGLYGVIFALPVAEVITFVVSFALYFASKRKMGEE